MTRRSLNAATLLFAVLALSLPAPSNGGTLERPALVTSAGQSSDVEVVKALLNVRLKLDFAVNPLAQPADLTGIKTLVIVVGSSTKGLGAAGLDMPKETARIDALVAAARARKIAILVLHTGGEARRGPTSNDLIKVVVPAADHIIVVAGGNKDKVFNTLAGPRQTPVVEVERLVGVGEAVKSAFGL